MGYAPGQFGIGRFLVVDFFRVARSLSFGAIVLCCGGLLLCASCKHATTPVPDVTIDSDVFDFGRCHQNEELSHTFSVTNRTDGPIKIVKALSSCSCVVAGQDGGLPDTTILPHTTLLIPVCFRTGSGQGAISGRVQVLYRLDKEQADSLPLRFFTMEMQADVIPDYRISPGEIDFGDIDGLTTQHVTRVLRINPEAAKSVTILGVRVAGEPLHARILPKVGDDAGCEVELSLDVSRFSESRSYGGSLVLTTDSK